MITGDAAGHNFKDGICECGRRFVDIQYYGSANVGEHGIAHSGALSAGEAVSIQFLKAKMDSIYEMNTFGRGVKKDERTPVDATLFS